MTHSHSSTASLSISILLEASFSPTRSSNSAADSPTLGLGESLIRTLGISEAELDFADFQEIVGSRRRREDDEDRTMKIALVVSLSGPREKCKVFALLRVLCKGISSTTAK